MIKRKLLLQITNYCFKSYAVMSYALEQKKLLKCFYLNKYQFVCPQMCQPSNIELTPSE